MQIWYTFSLVHLQAFDFFLYRIWFISVLSYWKRWCNQNLSAGLSFEVKAIDVHEFTVYHERIENPSLIVDLTFEKKQLCTLLPSISCIVITTNQYIFYYIWVEFLEINLNENFEIQFMYLNSKRTILYKLKRKKTSFAYLKWYTAVVNDGLM